MGRRGGERVGGRERVRVKGGGREWIGKERREG